MLTREQITIVNYLKNPSGMSTEKSLQLQNAMGVNKILNDLILMGYIFGPRDKPDAVTGDMLQHTTLTDRGKNL